jgi:hypothetical protein
VRIGRNRYKMISKGMEIQDVGIRTIGGFVISRSSVRVRFPAPLFRRRPAASDCPMKYMDLNVFSATWDSRPSCKRHSKRIAYLRRIEDCSYHDIPRGLIFSWEACPTPILEALSTSSLETLSMPPVVSPVRPCPPRLPAIAR